MSLKNYNPYLAFGGKIDPLSEIRNAGIVTNGDVYWVKVETDSDYTTLGEQVGNDKLVDTLQEAIDKTTSDHNDYIMVTPQNGGTVWTLGTAVDLDEDKVHIVGVGYVPGASSYPVTFRGFASSTVDTEMLYVTGNGCEMTGVKFQGTLGTHDGGTMSNGLAYINANDFYARSCMFEITQASFGSPQLILGGGTKHAARFDDCTFIVPDAQVESSGNAALVKLGNGGKRWHFNECRFILYAGSTTESFVACGTGAKEFTLFSRCEFINLNHAKAPASAFRGSTTVVNPVLLEYCTALNVTALGTDPTVYVAPQQAGTSEGGVHNVGIYLRGSAAVVAA